MASDEGCSLNFTIESTLYEEFSMDPSEPTQFDFVDLKPESSKSKIQKLVIILSVTFSSLVVAILLAVFFLKKKPGKGNENPTMLRYFPFSDACEQWNKDTRTLQFLCVEFGRDDRKEVGLRNTIDF